MAAEVRLLALSAPGCGSSRASDSLVLHSARYKLVISTAGQLARGPGIVAMTPNNEWTAPLPLPFPPPSFPTLITGDWPDVKPPTWSPVHDALGRPEVAKEGGSSTDPSTPPQ